MMLEDKNGREVEAMTVFSHCIKYMKDMLLEHLCISPGVELRDIQFTLTVPATWNETSRMFMWEAAIKVVYSNV